MFTAMRCSRSWPSGWAFKKGVLPLPIAPCTLKIMMPERLNPRPSSPCIMIGMLRASVQSPRALAAKTWCAGFCLLNLLQKVNISFRQVDPSDGDVQSEAMPLKPGVVFGKEYVGHKTANKSKGTVIAGMSMFAPRHLAKANQSIN